MQEETTTPAQLAYDMAMEGRTLVPGSGLSGLYYRLNPIGPDGMSRTGRWMEKHVWGDYSPMAGRITNAVDRLPERPRLARLGGFVTELLGTGNFFY